MIDWPNMGQTDCIMVVNGLELESSVHGPTITAIVNRLYLMTLSKWPNVLTDHKRADCNHGLNLAHKQKMTVTGRK